ncbi:MAG: vitamin K epoxide reductase family protein [Ruminococcaceae bacterium]|nr:vitamin K epoxide reductase family protein [Oscillospiraceae bacterium]
MKDFWKENGAYIGKMTLNQFGATFFGVMLVLAASAAQSQRTWLTIFASTFATVFYLFLVYTVLWEKGGQDRIRVDSGRKKREPFKGLLIAVCANIPNILLGVLDIGTRLVMNPGDPDRLAGKINSVVRAIVLLWEGMYAGFVSYAHTVAPNHPYLLSLTRLLIVIPALLVGGLAYWLGLNNKRLMQPFELKQPDKPQAGKSGDGRA